VSITIVLGVLIGVLGLAVGSFLNVVIWRVPRGESIVTPNSHCPSCEAPIRPRHNVPVLSWLALRGRCADCHSSINIRYPLVEAGTCALFIAVFLRFGPSPALAAYLFLAAVVVALTMIDWDVRRQPNSIVVPSYAVGLLLVVIGGAATGHWWNSVRALAGAALLWALCSALAIAYPGRVGRGDISIAGFFGLYLGWLSWDAVLIGALGALLVAGGWVLALRATRRVRRIGAVPVSACILIAGMLAVLVAAPVSAWYRPLIHLG
jgi:leader peptidase (prepilin peptidase)/N-methyltransferase